MLFAIHPSNWFRLVPGQFVPPPPQPSPPNILTRKNCHKCVLFSRTGFEPLAMESINWISRPTLYQLTHHFPVFPYDPQNSDMDHRIFNVSTPSF